MKLQKVNINDLISPEYNPRAISEEEMEKLKNSLKEFDYVDPLIVNDVNNHIVGGNQRWHALKELGYEEVEVVFIHEPNSSREKGLNIALNKISGDWDYPKLSLLIDELLDDTNFDISLTGFDNLDLQDLNIDLDDLDLDVGLGTKPPEKIMYTLIVDSRDYDEIDQLYQQLTDEGYDCRIKDENKKNFI